MKKRIVILGSTSSIGKSLLEIIKRDKKSFEIESYPNMLHSELTVSKKTFSQVHSFLDNIKNPILRSDLSADYEVVAQMQMKNIFEENNVISQNNYLKRNLYMVLFTILLNNPLDYFKLALSHFIGLWSTGFKFVYFENLNNKELNAWGRICEKQNHLTKI